MTQQNPYTKQNGFIFRFRTSYNKLFQWSQSNFSASLSPQSNIFSSCFEGGDSEAVVWALMDSALKGDYHLMRAIRFLGIGLWKDWLRIYHSQDAANDGR